MFVVTNDSEGARRAAMGAGIVFTEPAGTSARCKGGPFYAFHSFTEDKGSSLAVTSRGLLSGVRLFCGFADICLREWVVICLRIFVDTLMPGGRI
ncbi:hypothetical protein [Pantoea agglomerans]|uniref:hypothetical protein n=1 Tax=Enterobacter agglomerans TaxID=549 RepID=UPI0024139341|nr:hypothetical protein [Pantoea agglomerans]